MNPLAGIIQLAAQQPPAPPKGSFVGTQLVAAGIVLALVFLASNLRRLSSRPDTATPSLRRGGLATGWDRRMSTSKTIALAWTMVVAYMIVTLAILATSTKRGAGYFTSVFDNATTNTNNPGGSLELYLVLLGGPYAAAVLAKASVVSKLEKQDLQKSDASGPSPADLISNDTGAPSLTDFQYCLFNLIGLLAVVVLFWAHPGGGLPGIPSFLAILLGGSALTYTVNKAVERNKPSISSVHPTKVRVGETVSIVGDNLYLPAAPDAKTKVTVGGVEVAATAVGKAAGLVEQSDRIDFKVPQAKTGAWSADPQQVVLTTTADATVIAPYPQFGLGIVDDRPVLDAISRQPTLGDQLTLTGQYFYALGDTDATGKPKANITDPVVQLEWTDAQGKTHPRQLDLVKTPASFAPTDTQLTVTIPFDLVDAQAQVWPLKAQVSVRRGDGTKLDTTSVDIVKPTAAPSIDAVRPSTARVGQSVAIRGDNLSTTANGAQPTVTVGAGSPQPATVSQDGKQAAFKVPSPPNPPGSWPSVAQDLTFATRNKMYTVKTGQLAIEPDTMQLDSLTASQQAHVGGQLTVTGKHFYAPGDLDPEGKPIANATDPTVELTWIDSTGGAQRKQLTLVKTPAESAPRDTQLTAAIPADLVDPSALPLSSKLRIERAGTQSNQIDLVVTAP